MLRAVEEMSVAETALCLGISEELVKVRLHRARGRIREALGKKLGDDATVAFAFQRPGCDRVVDGVFCGLLERGLIMR